MLKSADYDALGRMKTIEIGEGAGSAPLVTNSYTYDASNARLTRVQGVAPSSTPLDLTVAFDGMGRLTVQSGTLGAESVSRSYTYDGLSRLKEAVGPWEKPTGETGNVTWTYSYDALGNLRQQASTLSDNRTWSYGHATKPHVLTAFAQANQPTETIGSNLGGEPASITRPGIPVETLARNAQGKLFRSKDSRYSYDVFDDATLVVTGPSGSTTSIVSVGEDFEYDIGALRANKHFSVGGVRIASLATSYTAPTASVPPALRFVLHYAEPLAAPAAAALLALGLLSLASLTLRRRTPVWLSVPGVGVLSFVLVALPYTAHAATLTSGPGAYGRHGEPILAYLVDHLGTIRGAVNQAGTVVETRDYAPFGESIAHTGAFSVQHRFTGQPQDDQAGGLYNYGARFYNAKWGRFISPDEMVQGFDSQGLNPFTYVLNQPTSGTDPTGNYFSPPPISIPMLGSGGAFGSSFAGVGAVGGASEDGEPPCGGDACITRPEYDELGEGLAFAAMATRFAPEGLQDALGIALLAGWAIHRAVAQQGDDAGETPEAEAREAVRKQIEDLKESLKGPDPNDLQEGTEEPWKPDAPTESGKKSLADAIADMLEYFF